MAIAFNNATGGASASQNNSYTLAHTATGSNGIVIVQASCENGRTISGITWNGNAMTQIGSNQPLLQSGTWVTSTWYYFAGTFDGASHNVVMTISGIASYARLNIASYTGVKQTGLDSYNQPSQSNSNPYALNTTVVGSGCWIIADGINDTGNITAGTGTTSRIAQAATIIVDSNGTVASGSQTLNIVPSSGGYTIGTILSIAPFVSNNSNFFMFF